MQLAPPLAEMIVTWPFGATSDDPKLAGVTHRGVDLRAPVGTPVYASTGGLIEPFSQYGEGLGNYLITTLPCTTLEAHDGTVHSGSVSIYYAHLLDLPPRQYVETGDEIALSGNSGFTTGAHLHWEVRVNGVPIDPMSVLEGGAMSEALDLARHVRWQIEEALREEDRAAELRAEAERLECTARRRRQALVNLQDGDAYALELLLGGDAPQGWEGLHD